MNSPQASDPSKWPPVLIPSLSHRPYRLASTSSTLLRCLKLHLEARGTLEGLGFQAEMMLPPRYRADRYARRKLAAVPPQSLKSTVTGLCPILAIIMLRVRASLSHLISRGR